MAAGRRHLGAEQGHFRRAVFDDPEITFPNLHPPPVLDVAGGPELEAENQILVAQFRQDHNPHQLERLIRGIQVVVDGQENLPVPLPIASTPVV